MIKNLKRFYIKALGAVAQKIDNVFMFVDNKYVRKISDSTAFYIFNFRVKNDIFD